MADEYKRMEKSLKKKILIWKKIILAVSLLHL